MFPTATAACERCSTTRWRCLSPDERTTFLALSVFRGGFTRDAAQAIAGASLRGLSLLANKSLVTPSPETARYSVHELLRQYGEVELRLDAEVSAQVDDAHAAFYAASMVESLALFVVGDQPRALGMIENDIDNVRSAWRHYLGAGEAARARPFVEGLLYLYETRGWYPAGMALFGEVLDALDEASEQVDVVRLRALADSARCYFLSLMGQPDVGEAAAGIANEILRGSPDLVGYMTVAQCWAISLAYLGRMEDMAACMDAAMEVADAARQPFWSAGMRNWRSFCAVMSGDIATAEERLPEASAVFEPMGEHYFMCWNLWLQAMIATQQGRSQDAIDLHTRQVETCRDIGYMRGTMVALEGLGEANIAAGSLEAAEDAFVEGMATADKMGMVRDMLGLMAKIAKVRASLGRPAEAVEILATVLAEPMSAQQPLTANTPIKDVAAEALDRIRETIEPEEYSDALAKGTSTPFDVAAKQLMTRRSIPA